MVCRQPREAPPEHEGCEMEQYTLEAYEALGYWQINVKRRYKSQVLGWDEELIYRGQHVPIDEEDPLVRAVLLLHQVHTDLSQAIRDDTDMLADRPAHH